MVESKEGKCQECDETLFYATVAVVCIYGLPKFYKLFLLLVFLGYLDSIVAPPFGCGVPGYVPG